MALYAWTGVRLGEHSCNVAGLLLGLFGEELGVVARRLGVNTDHLLVAAGTAALLHDAGKAAKKFQETLRSRRPSFVCHELVAGSLVYNTTHALLAGLDAGKEELLATIASIAALRHHHAMRTLGECIDLAKKQRVPGLSTEEAIELAAEIEEACPEATTLALVLQRLARDYTPLEGASVTRNAIQSLEETHHVSKELLSLAASALTGLLSLADYLAATTLDKRAHDPKPQGYTKQVLKELQYLITPVQGTTHLTTKLQTIALEGRKKLVQLLEEALQETILFHY